MRHPMCRGRGAQPRLGGTEVRVAAVDIGTNTVRSLLVDTTSSAVERSEHITGLGRGVDATGLLAVDAIDRTLDALVAVRDNTGHVDVLAVIATSASRDARNREEFFDLVEDVLGERPSLIDGSREAALAFAGARPSGAARVFTVVDLGGGSTEIVSGQETPTFRKSFDVGSVRITDRWLTDEADSTRLASAAADVARVLDTVPADPGDVLGVGGTFETLALMTQGHVDGAVLTRSAVADAVATLSALPVEDIAARPDIAAARAPVIVGGAVVAGVVMDRLGIESLTVTERGVLDGLVAELLAQSN